MREVHDHAVINVLYDMDAAVEQFRAVGFTVTPRGRHSLGSINHLMVFGSDYLELVGGEHGANPIRREVADGPLGLNGLVFRTDDADACFAALQERGSAAEKPLDFSRPVRIDGRDEAAAFRTVRLKPGAAQGGRVYFCQHLTPQFVWRPEWQSHANGVDRISEFTIVVPDPGQEARAYSSMLGVPALCVDPDEHRVVAGSLTVRFTTAARHRQRFGELAPPLAECESRIAALKLHTRLPRPPVNAFGAVIEFGA